MNILDQLKPLSEIGVADIRTKSTMSYFDVPAGTQDDHTLAKHHEGVARLQLVASVPDEVAVSFEVVRNLYLYSFFVYRFSVVACTQAFQTLEYALRERANLESVQIKSGLAAHLKFAVENGWFFDAAFAYRGINPKVPTNVYSKTLVKTIPGLRNELAHGSFTLFPPHEAFRQIEICASIINFVFEKPLQPLD